MYNIHILAQKRILLFYVFIYVLIYNSLECFNMINIFYVLILYISIIDYSRYLKKQLF